MLTIENLENTEQNIKKNRALKIGLKNRDKIY